MDTNNTRTLFLIISSRCSSLASRAGAERVGPLSEGVVAAAAAAAAAAVVEGAEVAPLIMAAAMAWASA